jgi:hypothetical protein
MFLLEQDGANGNAATNDRMMQINFIVRFVKPKLEEKDSSADPELVIRLANPELIAILVNKCGADKNTVSKNGETPLHLTVISAIKSRNWPFIKSEEELKKHPEDKVTSYLHIISAISIMKRGN